MKRYLLIILLLPIFLFSQQTTQTPPPPTPHQNIWQKIPDDSKHVYASGIIMMTASEIAWRKTHSISKSLAIGVGTSLTIGILGKEFIYDKWLGKGVYNKLDILYNCWGNLIFLLVERCWMNWKGYDYYTDPFDSQIKNKKHKNRWSLKNTGLLR